ncbi:hypothetical protein DIS24_g7299 [Lasiodiplodia hormozganensis]|uniref:Uncharacterized protein n=1 Tax=Lasiodiplodia hormozganensis TaxID=869390 RepID=A0AA39Y8A8_9PEZI|nr:hypothetical protein DIS24_g7299 [Lasiodiplodia hormozganensis]
MDCILNIFNFRRNTHLQHQIPRECDGLMRAPRATNPQLPQPSPLRHVELIEPAALSPPLPPPPGTHPTPSPPLLTILPLIARLPLSPVVSRPDIYHFSHSTTTSFSSSSSSPPPPPPQYTPPPAYTPTTASDPLYPGVSTAPSDPPPGYATTTTTSPTALASLRAALIQLDTAIYLHHVASTGRDDMAPTSQRVDGAAAAVAVDTTIAAIDGQEQQQQQQLHHVGRTVRSGASSSGSSISSDESSSSSSAAELIDLLPFLLEVVWTEVHALAGEGFV